MLKLDKGIKWYLVDVLFSVEMWKKLKSILEIIILEFDEM